MRPLQDEGDVHPPPPHLISLSLSLFISLLHSYWCFFTTLLYISQVYFGSGLLFFFSFVLSSALSFSPLLLHLLSVPFISTPSSDGKPFHGQNHDMSALSACEGGEDKGMSHVDKRSSKCRTTKKTLNGKGHCIFQVFISLCFQGVRLVLIPHSSHSRHKTSIRFTKDSRDRRDEADVSSKNITVVIRVHKDLM